MKIGWKVCIATAGLFLLTTICVGLTSDVHGQDGKGKNKGDLGRQEGKGGIFLTEIPEYKENIILGRPTGTSIVLSVLCDSDTRAVVAYGTQPANLSFRTKIKTFKKGEPREIFLEKLKPDTRYYYQMLDVTTNKILVNGTFQTQRRMGSTFTFTVTADSHLDHNTDPLLYSRTLENALTDAPDFHIDLGDTFMTDKHENRASAARQYLAQRFYLGQIGRSVALFLTLGNHDGEDSKLLRGGEDSLAVWSNSMRKRYFPNPAPDGFYRGNVIRDQFSGLLQDYYAWQWGDALFIVLNPYWHSTGRRGDDSWASTLGDTQYQWLKSALETSKSRFKFVFIHQLVGGRDRQGRGGRDAASFGEWGGKNSDGTEGFKEHRPGWDMPIHQLLVRNHATIVFHGHDHLYAREELGGIVYQEVPQPGFPRAGPPRAAEYGYRDGVILSGSGYIRVTVSPSKVIADYIRVYLSKDENAGQTNRQLAHSYTIWDSSH